MSHNVPFTRLLSFLWSINKNEMMHHKKMLIRSIKRQLDAQWENQLLSPHCVSCSFHPVLQLQLQLPSIIIPQFKSAWMSSAVSVLVCNVAEACRRPRRYSATLTLSEVLRLAPGSASQSALASTPAGSSNAPVNQTPYLQGWLKSRPRASQVGLALPPGHSRWSACRLRGFRRQTLCRWAFLLIGPEFHLSNQFTRF